MPCSAQVLFLEHLQRSCHLSLSLSLPLCLPLPLCLSASLSPKMVSHITIILARTCHWVYQDFHLINFSDLNALQSTGSISGTSSEIPPLAIIVRCHLSLSHVARLWRPYVWGIYKGSVTCHYFPLLWCVANQCFKNGIGPAGFLY